MWAYQHVDRIEIDECPGGSGGGVGAIGGLAIYQAHAMQDAINEDTADGIELVDGQLCPEAGRHA